MADKLFTIDEANALIPRLELIMARAQQHRVALLEAITAAAAAAGHEAADVDVDSLLEASPELREVIADLGRCLDEINACGGEIKGLELGLVDFPALRRGEVVLLCWQFGEKEITHFHGVDEGFSGRRPLFADARNRIVWQ